MADMIKLALFLVLFGYAGIWTWNYFRALFGLSQPGTYVEAGDQEDEDAGE